MRITPSRIQKPNIDDRAVRAVVAVLPRSVTARIPISKNRGAADLLVAGRPLELKWIGEGSLGDVRRVLSNRRRPDIVAARRLSPGAREALSVAGIGWVDETGAAEIALGSIIVSRTGRPSHFEEKPKGWTPAVVAVSEALLCGTTPTVALTKSATGLSVGSCTEALRFLSDIGLLEAQARRGRLSARIVSDPERLLEAYASAVERMRASRGLQIGVTWRDLVMGLAETGRVWDAAKMPWVATGAVAASVIAPHLTTVSACDVYVGGNSIAELEAMASSASLRPIEGGRLTLRPTPTEAVLRLSREIGGIRVAPWPRVYVDLRQSGVRGEEAAEHLREVVRAG